MRSGYASDSNTYFVMHGGDVDMTRYECLSVMIGFLLLVIEIIRKNDNKK